MICPSGAAYLGRPGAEGPLTFFGGQHLDRPAMLHVH